MKMTAQPLSRIMQHNCSLALSSLVVSGFLFLSEPICRADLTFDVTLNTSGLVGHPAGPFYIDFQLNDGLGNFVNGVNTAIITNFAGGSASGTPQRFGNATGSLSAGVTLKDDAAFVNEFFQPFTPGDALSFTVSLTTNVDPGPIHDAFIFSILDRSLSPIPTTNFADAFLFININSAKLSTADLGNSIFAGDPNRSPVAGGDVISIGKPQIPGVPESGSTIAILLIGIGAVWGFQRRFRQLA